MPEVETSRDGAVLTITLNRPDVLNAFTAEMHSQLVGAFRDARGEDVRAVVITGAGRGFCVGQDLNEFGEAARDIAGRLRTNYHPTIRAVRELEKPVIAAVNGPAAGPAPARNAQVRDRRREPLGHRDHRVRVGVERFLFERHERDSGHASKLATGL